MPHKPSARKRVSLACEECRAKRRRCDGGQPECGSCRQKNTHCEYRHEENKRRPPSKRYVESLQAHIAILEDRLTALGEQFTRIETAQPNAALDDDLSEPDPDAVPDPSQPSSSSPEAVRDPVEELTQRAGRLNIGEDGQLRYFGAQSNYHLLHGPLYNASTQSIENLQIAGLATAGFLGKTVEVSQDLQEHLLGLYWRWQNPWLYMIHKESFMRDYRNGKTGGFCSPLLLSAIFALASRFSDSVDVRSDPADPHSAGNAFAEQAKILLHYECEAPTTTTVQAACLLSLRWMSENKESLGWVYMGMATRMAYNLGLNLDCSDWVSSGMMTEQDVEVRRITWWGCYKLDKFVLPLFILPVQPCRPFTYVPPPLGDETDFIALAWAVRGLRDHLISYTCKKPTIEREVEFDPWVPRGAQDDSLLGAHARTVSAMRYSCDHLSLISGPLETIYAPGNKLTRAEADRIVTEADVAFNAFYNGLPSHLRLPSSPRVPALPHIYQLHIQFHVFQIQLHRPFIRRFSPLQPEPTDSSSQVDLHMKACRRSATEITRILRMYQFHYNLRLTPVVTVVNTFSAAVIHLMDATSPDGAICKSALRSLQVCVPALEAMAVAWMWSRRALRAIRLLAHEWLIPQAVSFDRRKSAHLEFKTGSQSQLQPQSRLQSRGKLGAGEKYAEAISTGGPQAPSTLPATNPQLWEFETESMSGVPKTHESQAQQLVFPAPEEHNAYPYMEDSWLFDLDAVGHVSGEFDGAGQTDPWFASTVLAQPFSLEHWAETSILH